MSNRREFLRTSLLALLAVPAAGLISKLPLIDDEFIEIKPSNGKNYTPKHGNHYFKITHEALNDPDYFRMELERQSLYGKVIHHQIGFYDDDFAKNMATVIITFA